MGFILALQLMKQSFQITTSTVTIILDNQGVVKDLANKKTSSRALTHKIMATEHIRKVWSTAPHVKIILRWCPGHKGIIGNETADKLANAAAKKLLPPSHTDKSTFASFRAAIKSWAAKEAINNFTLQDIKRLGHEPHPKQHIAAL